MKGLLAIVLGIIGSERPEALDDYASKSTAVELLKILYKGGTGQYTQVCELRNIGREGKGIFRQRDSKNHH